ncbi:MAG: phosphate signaling complex protein PhoU [Anaeroplasma sp.]
MKLEQEIEHLIQMLLKMADAVENNLRDAINVYYQYDSKKIDLVNDDVVDLYERLIEEMCLNIMLRERPYAKDLRIVSGILKLVADLERLGDHAEDIVDFSKKLIECDKHQIPDLDKAITISLKMVHNSVLSFVNKDVNLAKEVINTDDEVDSLYDTLLKYIIKENENKTFSSSFAIYNTLVIKYIERIADHAVNVAEWVIYILSGYHKDKQIF